MDRLNTNQQLSSDDRLTSQANLYYLIYQSDGNLVIYDNNGGVAWASGTDGSSVGRVIMQDDGNFVMYDAGDAAVWSTGTDGNPGAVVVMQDDANLVVYATDGSPLWASQDQNRGGGIFGAIAHGIGAVAGDIVKGVQTVVNAVEDTVEGIASPFLNAAGFIVGLIEAIPVIGRVIAAVLDYVTDIINRLASLPEILFVLLGWMPEKRLRIMVIIQRSRGSEPVADIERVRTYIQQMIDVYHNECNVRVLPALPFHYSSPFQGTPQVTDAYYANSPVDSDNSLLSVRCGNGAYTDDLGITSGSGPAFELLMNISKGFWGSFRRVVGIGAPITTFAVQKFTTPNDGCSDYIGVDYVLVLFKPQQRDDIGVVLTLAHENGHACGLWHTDGTVMASGPGGRNLTFNKLQKIVVRTSRHVSYL